jgi:hypothetical protein
VKYKSQIIGVCILLLAHFTNAQVRSAQLLKDLSTDDSVALATVASYPDSVRPAVLEACKRPDILVQAESLQKKTSQQFRDLVEKYPRDEQKKLWDLARYPFLLKEISAGGKKSKEELEKIAEKYPSALRPAIKEYGHKHYEVINEMNDLYTNSQVEFKKILDNTPSNTQQAFSTLSNRPDILNTLSNNTHLTVILGEMHKNDPAQTVAMLDSIRTENAKTNAKDFEEWKNGLEQNPQAKKELEQAASEFSKENEDPNANVDDVYKTSGNANVSPTQVYSSAPVINNYYMQPYPYWFGYPSWYDYPFWYPYPYWYNTGFYWGPGGMVWIGFPSPFFMHWYLYHPYHNYYYPYFTDYCVGYNQVHYGPRHSRTGFNSEIHQWSRVNQSNLPSGYFHPDAQRPQRIKELGKFEMDYHNSTKGMFGRNITRSEFLKNNPNYYPHMSPAVNQPHFDQRINYPQQQNPVKFNMNRPEMRQRGGFSQPMPGGGFPKGGGGGMSHPRK